jgi:hypothetical protein
MRAILNRQMFTARTFDSGAIGVLASLVHQFPSPGRYEAVIRRGDKPIRSVSFEVSDASPNMQLDIDLAPPEQPRGSGDDDCACKGSHASGTSPRTVSPKGYVLFHVSRGDGGYSVLVVQQGSDKPAFDSTRLGAGDLFALSLLAPTRYKMTNRIGKATGTIVVRMAPEVLRKLATAEAIYVETSQDEFSPADVQAGSAQGIVFRVRDAARIVIEQVEEPPDDKKPRSPRRIVMLRAPAPPASRTKTERRAGPAQKDGSAAPRAAKKDTKASRSTT